MFKKWVLLSCLVISSSLYAGASDWYPMEISDGILLVDVVIGGKKTKAALDTGASTTVVNVDFLKRNNIGFKKGSKVTLQGVYGEKVDSLVKNVDIELFGFPVTLKRSLPMYGERNYDMLLGLPFFKNFIVQIDYPQSRLRLITRDSGNLNSIANVPVMFTRNKTALVVKLSLSDGSDVDLLLDTGSSGGVLLERSFIEARGWEEKYMVAQGTSSGVIKENVGLNIMEIPELKFGPYPIEDVIVSTPVKGISSNISQYKAKAKLGTKLERDTGYDGILGYDLLRHFVITLDAKIGKMHIFAP